MDDGATDRFLESTVKLAATDAQPLLRCLQAELGRGPASIERIECIYFTPREGMDPSPATQHDEGQRIELRATERSREPGSFTLESRRIEGEAHEATRVRVSRKGLLAAARPHALQELLSSTPMGWEPAFAVQANRRIYSLPAGWAVALDQDVRFSTVVRSRDGVSAGDLLARENDPIMTVTLLDGALPTWLVQLARAATAYDIVSEGLRHRRAAKERPSRSAQLAAIRREREERALMDAWFE